MKILIDIGHAEGSGARGNGCEEHELCAVIGRELAAIFEGRGDEAVVIDFPEKGNAGDLEATAREANRHGDAVCGISLHMDCAESAGKGAGGGDSGAFVRAFAGEGGAYCEEDGAVYFEGDAGGVGAV